LVSTGDCRECQDFRGCPGKDWYGFHEIRWCAQQIFWILKFEEYFHAGEWPAPDATADPGVRHHVVKREAAHVKASLTIAEVDKRLKLTGIRGRLLKEECFKRDKMLYLSWDAKGALYYVAGSHFKRQRKFSAWMADRKHRKSDKSITNART